MSSYKNLIRFLQNFHKGMSPLCTLCLQSCPPGVDRRIFFLLYGRDPQLPTEAAVEWFAVNRDDSCSHMVHVRSEAWGLAQSNIKKAQKKQKEQHDKRARDVPLKIGQRVFLHVPSLKSGPAHKLARPYWITALHPNGAELQSVDHPNPSSP